jgi:hypothetical protein
MAGGTPVTGNPLNSSLNLNAITGPLGLNPSAMQGAQNQQLTAQSQQAQQNMANVLKNEAQKQQKMTSPWQVAGQWAQALQGRMKQNQANQGAAGLAGAQNPSGPGTPAAGAMPTPNATGAPPAGAANPALPAYSGAPPPGTVAPQGAAAPPVPPPQQTGMGAPPVDLSDMFG